MTRVRSLIDSRLVETAEQMSLTIYCDTHGTTHRELVTCGWQVRRGTPTVKYLINEQ